MRVHNYTKSLCIRTQRNTSKVCTFKIFYRSVRVYLLGNNLEDLAILEGIWVDLDLLSNLQDNYLQ